MKRSIASLLLLPATLVLAGPPSPAVVTPRTLATTPVSALLYSHFIELGYGIQVEPMWGELLFNRSFEPYDPYRDINVCWFNLFVNFSNLANTHSQCVIDTPKEGAYLTAAGKAFELLAHSPAAWPLKIKDYTANPKDPATIINP